MKIGLFGGSFNPVHNGHLIIAERVLSEFNLDKIIFIPAAYPPHKDAESLFSKEDRYQMLVLAIADNKKFEISPLEMSGEYLYSYQSIEYFLSKKTENDELFFLLGMDSLNNLDQWKKGLQLLDLCKFVVISRLENSTKFEHKNILYLDTLKIGISSTMIRDLFKANKSVRYFLPLAVERYLLGNNLFVGKDK